MSMEAEKFDLIFEGVSQDSAGVRRKLIAELKKQCVSQIFEVDSLLDGGPFLLQRSPDKAEIERFGEALRRAGAKVLIVRSRNTKPKSLKTNSGGTVVEFPAKPEHAPRPDETTFRGFFQNYAKNLIRVLHSVNVQEVEALIEDILKARECGRQIFVCGNGGSAASASHMATDFSKQRFEDEKLMFRIMSLNDNTSWITATANDMGYEHVFENQLKNLLQPEDVVIGISSSGNSPNITRAIDYANAKGAITYGIVGFNGGELIKKAQKSVFIPSKIGQYGYMEDITLIINHMMSIFIYERDKARLA